MSPSFSDKVAIVTGASSGLGETIALQMAKNGARVTLCGRDQAKLDSVQQKCSEIILSNRINNTNDKNDDDVNNSVNPQERLLVVSGDVTSHDCRKRIIESTIEKFGQLDILIPNAGVTFPGQSVDLATEEVYNTIMDTNLKSVFFLVQEAVPFLEKSKGVVVCMSSIYGTVPSVGSTVYCVAKAGLDHMVRCLAISLGPKGIRVNAVKPSYVRTEITRNYPNAHQIPAAFGKIQDPLHPLEGRCCTREEVADVTLFLASTSSSFITGECFHVDGGRRFLPA